MAAEQPTAGQLADAYLAYCRLQWADSWIFHLIHNNPSAAWDVLNCVVEKADSPEIEDLIACGPFKIFILVRGEEYIAEICEKARESDVFLRVLRGVRGIESLPPAVRNRLRKII